MHLLTLCPECARHVKRAESRCPFCAAALDASGGDARVEEDAPRMSRSAILLAGAAMMAGCNLPSSADIYGGPPRPLSPSQPDVTASAPTHPQPPPIPVPPYGAPVQPEPPPPTPAADAGPGMASIYGGPPSPPPRHGHGTHHRAPTPPPHPVPVPAYGISPPPGREPNL